MSLRIFLPDRRAQASRLRVAPPRANLRMSSSVSMTGSQSYSQDYDCTPPIGRPADQSASLATR